MNAKRDLPVSIVYYLYGDESCSTQARRHGSQGYAGGAACLEALPLEVPRSR